jgi:hypothetical protein
MAKPTEPLAVRARAPSVLALALALVLGVWIGASAAVLGVVGYSFPGIERALQANDALRARAGFSPRDDSAKKSSTLWVLVGELNRHIFAGWNRAQLVLAAVALVFAARGARRTALALVAVAAVAVLVLTFYLAPEITARGRALDFVPRDPTPPEEAEFRAFHSAYTALEVAKTLAIAAAGVLTLGPGRCENPPQDV